MRAAAIGLAILAAASPALADDDGLAGASVIFARGGSLFRVDAHGKGETEIATLPDKTTVRALRSDAGGSVLLADLGGTAGHKWSWMPLDGSTKTLAELPCADGPAQLAEDGSSVVCRSPDPKVGGIVYDLGKQHADPVAVSANTVRLASTADGLRLVWADAGGVWSAPADSPGRKVKVAPSAPLRHFLASPDGKRAVGVFGDQVYVDVHHKKAADVLMGFALDGDGARRKAIRDGVPVEWSHDAQWVLVQDGGKACLMRAVGGEYKCWNGFTAASVASDASWALVLGNRDGKAPPAKGAAGKKPAPAPPAAVAAAPDEPTDDVGGEGEPAGPDVAVPPPSGPLSLYRGKLAGPYTEAPVLVVKVVDGAAVWIAPKPKTP